MDLVYLGLWKSFRKIKKKVKVGRPLMAFVHFKKKRRFQKPKKGVFLKNTPKNQKSVGDTQTTPVKRIQWTRRLFGLED